MKPSTMSVVLRQKIVESLNKRWELFSTRIHISSFMLDPRFRHIPSSTIDTENEAHFQSAEEFIRKYDFNADKWAAGLQQAWIDFRSEEGVFSNVCRSEKKEEKKKRKRRKKREKKREEQRND